MKLHDLPMKSERVGGKVTNGGAGRVPHQWGEREREGDRESTKGDAVRKRDEGKGREMEKRV